MKYKVYIKKWYGVAFLCECESSQISADSNSYLILGKEDEVLAIINKSIFAYLIINE